MKITAETRTSVKHNHALITPDGYVSSAIPGWENCEINVIINPAMGAKLSQLHYTMEENGTGKGQTEQSEIFFYIVKGTCDLTANGQRFSFKKGSYVYLPPKSEYQFTSKEAGTKLLSFTKEFESLDGFKTPEMRTGHESDHEQNVYLDDPQLLMQNLIPDDLAFDMAVNIFTYLPGGNLPFVETHIMEHGLLYLAGQGIYRLDDEWYPVQEGDAIWMAPYCPQWFTAMGKEPAVYIYYKNTNRFPQPY